MAGHVLELSPWESFYVITGSSAAALTGLMFVVITLAAEIAATNPEGLGGFATPTVVHFGIVLLVASVLTMPGHTVRSLTICLVGCLVIGTWITVAAIQRVRQQTVYKPVAEDWIWHVISPVAAYSTLFIATIVLQWRPTAALYVVAAVVILLLFTGIHNSWDTAVWLVMSRSQSNARASASSTPASPAPQSEQGAPQ